MSSGIRSPVFFEVESISVEQARTGEPTASIGTLRIHSAYNPDKEARKFLEKHLSEISPGSYVVILGAALGYLDRVLEELIPECRIIAVHFDTDLFKSVVNRGGTGGPGVCRWHPDSGTDLESFLFQVLKESSISRMTVLEWPACRTAFPEQYNSAAASLTSVIRRYSGNISTTAAFGRHWIKNSFRNFIDTDRVLAPEPAEAPVVLAVSGPSLENSTEIIRTNRTGFQLWALPSALPSLLHSGISPDMIIATDPGYWARLHNRYCPEGVPVAMPLSAAPRTDWSGGTLLLAQGIPGEEFLLKDSQWPKLTIPAMGTVAATAIEIWKMISRGPLFIAGLDLCWDDLRSHARPHAFDGWISSHTSRYNPLYNEVWNRAAALAPNRSGKIRTGSALQTYREWFAGNLPGERAFRLVPPGSDNSWIPIPGMRDRDVGVLGNLPSGVQNELGFRSKPSPLSRNRREELVGELLSKWKKLIAGSEGNPDMETEVLMYTLDPGGVLEIERSRNSERRQAQHRHRERVMREVAELESIYG